MKKNRGQGFEGLDVFILIILLAGAFSIVFPVFNVLAISFTTNKEYLSSSWILWPKVMTVDSYRTIFGNNRILVGYKTTLTYILIGVPLNLLLSTSLAYALASDGWPGKKIVLAMVLITMIFNGGIVPLYLVMKSLGLTDTIWAVILASGMSTFNMILVMNYFRSLPESLKESARLDGANEWTILFRIVLPLAKPILATICLFVMVQFWNEYFMSMIFLRSNNWQSLQQVLRSIVVDAQVDSESAAVADIGNNTFAEGIKMAAVVATMVPIMCVYPFLQKYFVKGVMIGAIKA